MEGGQGKGHQGSGHKPPEDGPVAPFREGTQPLSTRMRRAVGAGSCLFWELCSGVFSGTRVLRQDPPPPRCHQGPARGRRLSPSRSGLPGACPQHLLAKLVRDACRGALGSGNRTLETGPLAVSSGFCLLGTGLRTQASAFGVWLRALRPGLTTLCSPCPKGAFWTLRPWFRAPNAGLCAPALGSAPLAVGINISAMPVWFQDSQTHTEERGPLPHPTSS